MPYIEKECRHKYDEALEYMANFQNAGELNYFINMACIKYLSRYPKLSYTGLNEIIGVLECAKLEFYRRIAAEYENTKITENGDVYD